MRSIAPFLISALLLYFGPTAQANDNKSAQMSAVIQAGALEIVPSSLERTFTPTNSNFQVTAELQKNAINFLIDSITINDLNGDGRGWQLRARTSPLTNGDSSLPVGQVKGFKNPSIPRFTRLRRPTVINYNDPRGVENYKIDFDVSYDIPALADSGTYKGEVTFILRAN